MFQKKEANIKKFLVIRNLFGGLNGSKNIEIKILIRFHSRRSVRAQHTNTLLFSSPADTFAFFMHYSHIYFLHFVPLTDFMLHMRVDEKHLLTQDPPAVPKPQRASQIHSEELKTADIEDRS